MSNYTPGPWKVNEAHGYTVMGEGEEVASTWLAPVSDAAALANARLIAAAPDLFRLLEEARDIISDHLPAYEAWLDASAIAIAKVEEQS
jgi:hypothetical protein